MLGVPLDHVTAKLGDSTLPDAPTLQEPRADSGRRAGAATHARRA